MNRNVLYLYVFVVEFCASSYYDYFDNIEELLRERSITEIDFMSNTTVSILDNFHVNAVPVPESDYPWIARVIHSRTLRIPHACTAVCIDKRIFITAARCMYSLQPYYTRVVYQYHPLQAIAHVLPSKSSKQMFDDIGFIVVDDSGFTKEWETVPLFDTTNRTDMVFEWFTKLNPIIKSKVHLAVGYATKKGLHKMKSPYMHYDLHALKVIVDIKACAAIFTRNYTFNGFHIPCYSPCTPEEFWNQDTKCINYLGVEGAAVINTEDDKLLGIATWGYICRKSDFPVGFSVPNSDSFFEDYECARRIRNIKTTSIKKGSYQSICDEINEINSLK